MKRAFLLLLIVPSVLAFCGCTEMSPEDREFYGKGWIHPGELDKERPTAMPAHPETSGSLGAEAANIPAATGTTAARSAQSTAGWTPDDY